MNFSAVILAGGKSSRMGRDKAWLEIGGQTLLARQIALVRELGAAEVFISGRPDVDYSAFDCRVLQDKFPDTGPLAGIERALDAVKSPLLLVLAVDLPEMSGELLRRLSAGAAESFGSIPKLADGIEPLAAFYPKAALPLLLKLFTASERRPRDRPAKLKHADRVVGAPSVKQFAELCVQSGLAGYVELGDTDTRYFANWNSPADLTPASPKPA
ncbi:MAG TPA: molybdenum cofactor guanylyltransferase [Verrucomicrobiae bacterium]|nr:molybdenum cofactor guanylyltransferase [Verrucomicrobiae bacterium]